MDVAGHPGYVSADSAGSLASRFLNVHQFARVSQEANTAGIAGTVNVLTSARATIRAARRTHLASLSHRASKLLVGRCDRNELRSAYRPRSIDVHRVSVTPL